MTRARTCVWLLVAALASASGPSAGRAAPANQPRANAADARAAGPRLPLVAVRDVELPGGSTRFDYQAIDHRRAHLVVAHMNDGSLLFIDLRDGSVLKEVKGIPVARGVAVAEDAGLVFVTSSPHELAIIDGAALSLLRKVETGR